MFVLTYIAIGFITVFGWNTGQKVWDKYVEQDTYHEVQMGKVDNGRRDQEQNK